MKHLLPFLFVLTSCTKADLPEPCDCMFIMFDGSIKDRLYNGDGGYWTACDDYPRLFSIEAIECITVN